MVAIAATVATAYVLLPVAVWAFARVLTLTLNGCVWLAASISSGTDVWTILQTVGRATLGTLGTPQVSGVIAALIVVGALALFGLQRLLASEEDARR